MIRKLTWKKELIDERDYKYKFISPKISLPSSIDLRAYDSSVGDQGEVGSCTGWAVGSAIENRKSYNGCEYWDVSKLFIYFNARSYDGEAVNSDSGAYIRDTIKGCKNVGICKDSLWDYSKSAVAYPFFYSYVDGMQDKISSYWKIEDLDLNSVLTALASGDVVVFGFYVYNSFYGAEENGIVPEPQAVYERILGGHAVVAVGYTGTHIICKNSWGSDWGDNGYIYMPYSYFTTYDTYEGDGHTYTHVSDIWVLRS